MRRALPLAAAALLACGDDPPETLVPTTEPAGTTTTASSSSSSSSSGEPDDDGSSSESSGSEAATSGEDEGASSSSSTSSGGDSSSSSGADTSTGAAVCGDGIAEGDEACDDGNDDETDDCTSACAPPACGDGFLQPGEECDDGNGAQGDGCDAGCAVELECGKTFTLEWCKQVGPTEQYTRCAEVKDAGHTCTLPEIRYGDTEGGIPLGDMVDSLHESEILWEWCQQLGFNYWDEYVDYGGNPCAGTPECGPVVWIEGGEDTGWHWGEFHNDVYNDGLWRGPEHALNEDDAGYSDIIAEIRCGSL